MKTFLLLFLTLAALLHARIFETPHFQALSDYAEDGTLILLDIDDTLLVPKQMLGCDEWFQYRLEMHQKEGMQSRAALEKTLAEWEAVRHLTEMELVEAGTEEIIRNLQEKKVVVMGLTTQGLALATRTTVHLLEQKIDLTLTAPSKEDHYFAIKGHGVLFRNGIFFTSGMHKGVALFKLLDDIGIHPARIVFINDKASHLSEIETTANERSVEFIGLRYSFSDLRKKHFRSDVAEYQFAHSTFTQLLSDQEAIDDLFNK